MRALLALGSLLLGVPAQLPSRAQAPLPASGIAVQTSAGVVLTDPSGRIEKTLAGYRLRSEGVERPGQVELRDRGGHDWELRAGKLAPVEKNSIGLTDGWRLTLSGQWVLQRGSHAVRYPSGTQLSLDASGTLLNVVRRDAPATYVRNLRTGTISTLPRGCRIGARVGKIDYELCGSSIVRVDPKGRHLLAGPAQPSGSWQQLLPGPYGQPLLAQWFGRCRVQTAYFVDRAQGHRVQLGDERRRHVVSQILGWVGTTPLAWLPASPCGVAASPPGVYAYDATGRPLLVYKLSGAKTLVRFWG